MAIQALGGIAGAVTGLTGGILGGLSRNKALKKQIAALKDQQANVDVWRDQNANEDGTQSVAYQNIINENARRMSRAARAAEAKRAMGFEDETAGVKEANAAQAGSLLAGAAAAQQARNNDINDKAFEKKQTLQSQINELEAGKANALDIVNGAVAGATSGFEKGMGLQGLVKQA